MPASPATLAPCRASASDVNPNAGKRRPGTLGTRKPRTSAPRGVSRSAVTVLYIDPASLRRSRKPGQNTPESTLDRATVVARCVKTRAGIRAAAESIRESVVTTY